MSTPCLESDFVKIPYLLTYKRKKTGKTQYKTMVTKQKIQEVEDLEEPRI